MKQDLLRIMDSWAPESDAETWDNVGLQIDTPTTDIQSVAIALEINLDTLDILSKRCVDMIITHHPLIFSPISAIDYSNWTHRVLQSLMNDGIGLYVAHTNLDKAVGGVTDALVEQYNVGVHRATDIAQGYGKILHLKEPADLDDMMQTIPVLANVIPSNRSIEKIAFCGGSGKGFVHSVIQKKVDLYITGELGYHDIQMLRQQNIGVILLGHYQSEIFILDKIRDRLQPLNINIDVIY